MTETTMATRMMATTMATTSASNAAIGSGMPAATAKKVTMPPIMTNSPCAKLITSEAL